MSTAVVSPAFVFPRRSAPSRQVPAREVPVRLTRRGRIALVVLFLAVVLTALTVFGSTSAATGEAGEPLPTRTVVVEPGDTLWGIASEVAGPGEVRATVHHIQELNALPGAALAVGQQLAVPVAE